MEKLSPAQHRANGTNTQQSLINDISLVVEHQEDELNEVLQEFSQGLSSGLISKNGKILEGKIDGFKSRTLDREDDLASDSRSSS